MKICIVGAGAVGGYFGGRMAEAGLDVTFLVRENRARQLAGSGLVIKSPLGDFTLPDPKLEADSQKISACDLVILAVKNYQLEGAMAQLGPWVKLGAKVLPLLNGVEHFDLLAKEFGPENILGGMCQIISTLDAAGLILHTSQLQNITFGALHPSQAEFCLQLEQELKRTTLKVALSSDIKLNIWLKYTFITAYSGVTTASRLSIDQIIKHKATKQVYVRALQEMSNLAKANGVSLPDNFVQQNLAGVESYSSGSTSSMHQDFRKGLPLEVESLQGAAVRLGDKFKIEVPTVRTLYGLIKPYENGTSLN